MIMKLKNNYNEYPCYPHTSGRMGATARDSPIGLEVDCCCCCCYGCCVLVVAYMCLFLGCGVFVCV